MFLWASPNTEIAEKMRSQRYPDGSAVLFSGRQPSKDRCRGQPARQGPGAAPALLCAGPAMVPVGEASMAVLSLPTQMAKMEQRQI